MSTNRFSVELLNVANQVEDKCPIVSDAIRRACRGEKISPIWLSRWTRMGQEWEEHHRENPEPERTIGHALVLRQNHGNNLYIANAHGSLQPTWLTTGPRRWAFPLVLKVDCNNQEDLRDAEAARFYGWEVKCMPTFPKPEEYRITTLEEFAGIIKSAYPMWVDDAPICCEKRRDYFCEEGAYTFLPTHNNEREWINIPAFEEMNESVPGFVMNGIPSGWRKDPYSWEAFSCDGSMRFYVHFKSTDYFHAEPKDMEKVTSSAEWRISRYLVEHLVKIQKATAEQQRELEQVEEQKKLKESNRNEKIRLAQKFGIKL